jgi:hypothetical protein
MAQDTASTEGRTPFALTVTWALGENLEAVFVDNLHLAQVNDLFYLTFGQIRIPAGQEGPGAAAIHPMVRLVLTRSAMKNIVGLMSSTQQGDEQS